MSVVIDGVTYVKQTTICEVDQLIRDKDNEIARLQHANNYLKGQRANEIAAWREARDYWRDKASEYGTALAVSDKAVAIYENAIDCLTAEVETLRMHGAHGRPSSVNGVPIETVLNLITSWRLAFCPPISAVFYDPADLRTAKADIATANEAIKLLGEGFAREINAANAYRAGLIETSRSVSVFTLLGNVVRSALAKGDAARKAPKASNG